MASELQVGKVVVGDSSTNELLVGFESSSQDFSLGANGTNFMVCANATDLDNNELLRISSTGLATFTNSGSQHIVISDGAGTPSTWDFGRDSSTGSLVIRQNASTKMTVSGAGLANFTGGITVEGANNWSHISASDTQSLSLADDAQIQISDNEAGAIMIHIYDRGSGAGGVIFATYYGQPELVAGSTNYFDVADTDGKFCVIKSNSSHDVYFKNRGGATKQFCILVTAGVLDNF